MHILKISFRRCTKKRVKERTVHLKRLDKTILCSTAFMATECLTLCERV